MPLNNVSTETRIQKRKWSLNHFYAFNENATAKLCYETPAENNTYTKDFKISFFFSN